MYLDIFFQEFELGKNTQESYSRTIQDMMNYLDKPITEISSIDLSKWKTTLTNLSISTQSQKISAIKSYFRFLQEFDIRKDNPALVIRLPKETEKQKHKRIKQKSFMSYEEAKNLMENTINPRYKAIIALYLNTGLRVQELIDLQLEDYLNFINHQMPIEIETKGGKYREVIFNTTTVRLINNYLEIRKDKAPNLFTTNQGNPLNRQNLNKTLKNISKNQNISNHSFRACKAMHVYETHGINEAQELLGHSTVNTTRIYLKNKQKRLNKIMEEEF